MYQPFQPNEYIDENVMNRLLGFMSQANLQELFSEFKIEFQESIILAKVNESKREDVFHKLKGTSYTLGLNKLGNECYFCELNYLNWNDKECLTHIQQIDNIFNTTLNELTSNYSFFNKLWT
jgi:hypothetical protein